MAEAKLLSAHAVDDLGIHPDVVAALGMSGVDTATLLRYLVCYGPTVILYLAQAFGIKLPPLPLPIPPPLPPLPLSNM